MRNSSPASKIKIYEYQNCSTCKKALKFLEQNQIPYEKLPIVDQPPSLRELRKMLVYVGSNLRKLFNTSGQQYRELGLGEKLGSMSETQALELLAKHGKLVKRPFALGADCGMVGFNEAEWKKALRG